MDTKFYKKLAEKMNFKSGDFVRVLRKANSHELGWGEVWDSLNMDESIGQKFTVVREDEGYGVGLWFKSCCFYFPCYVLELIEIPERVDIKISQWCSATVTKHGIDINYDGCLFALPFEILDKIIEARKVVLNEGN